MAQGKDTHRDAPEPQGIEDLTTKAALERFVKDLLAETPHNQIPGLDGRLSTIENRLDEGGL